MFNLQSLHKVKHEASAGEMTRLYQAPKVHCYRYLWASITMFALCLLSIQPVFAISASHTNGFWTWASQGTNNEISCGGGSYTLGGNDAEFTAVGVTNTRSDPKITKAYSDGNGQVLNAHTFGSSEGTYNSLMKVGAVSSKGCYNYELDLTAVAVEGSHGVVATARGADPQPITSSGNLLASVSLMPGTGLFVDTVGDAGGWTSYTLLDPVSGGTLASVKMEYDSSMPNGINATVIFDTSIADLSFLMMDFQTSLTSQDLESTIEGLPSLNTEAGLSTETFLFGYERLNLSSGQELISIGESVAFTSAVPVPPAMVLFGSGLLGLLSVARKRKKP